MAKEKKLPKQRCAEAAALSANRKAFGQAGPMKDRRKEASRKWARSKQEKE